jgi:putative transposase
VEAIGQLSGEERALAMQRFHLLEPHLGGQKDLQSISKGVGISVRTLQRWILSYRRVGLAGLVKKGRRDKGGRRAVSPRLREAIEGLALEKPALPLTSVHRQVKQFAQMIGEAEPSYCMVRDVALSIPNDLRTLAQQGARRYGELFDLVHRREESRPNALCRQIMPS